MISQRSARSGFAAASTCRTNVTMLIFPVPLRQRAICHGVAHFSSSSAARKPVSPSDKSSQVQPVSHSASSSTSTSVHPHLPSALNPPQSTRPAQLELPEKSANSSGMFKYYISLGKAYYAFYKTGLKNVYHNYRAAAPIRKRLGFSGYLPTSLPPRSLSGTAAFEQLVRKEGVTRAEFQLLRRSAYDIRRMIPFVLILIVCGEFTPLIVLALGSRVTPLTCRIPKQLEKERRLKLDRKSAALRAAVTSFEKEWLNATTLPKSIPSAVRHASANDILSSCAVLGLSKSHRLPAYIPGFMQATFVNLVYRPKLRRWLEYLSVDDSLMREAGGAAGLTADEVRIAVEERGGVDVGADRIRDEEKVKIMRRWLGRWIEDGGKA
ncbi:hypothetical protein D8B26_001227 [Coccidioides posadasii str. Silveira]|uniref:Uncharacterized protein n=2 Tax=Coccidioides posadasii TaxID=199306 RepID=E9DA83_COCPS|nr:conserved hypothetical protein [Coccidioides posadasii str. Silveira]QVM06519.1 hypothetical protein D8B26_001227 [Coccidioides posadasii str. Silveira]